MRVLIFGASGFVGTAVTHGLRDHQCFEVVPIIHSPASAWSLARQGAELVRADLLDQDKIIQVVRDADAVVNCSRGSSTEVMLGGLKTLLAACQEAKVKRFIHLSSIAVYGDLPGSEAVVETATPFPTTDYGRLKLQQDLMVEAAHQQNGLECVMLCPPNIGGVESLYFRKIQSAVASGSFALLDEGQSPCCLADVDNLAGAVASALNAVSLPGRRLFVLDEPVLSWKALIDDLLEMRDSDTMPKVERSLLESKGWTNNMPQMKPGRALKHLVSSPVREALRRDPLWSQLDQGVRGLVGRLPSIEARLRRSIEGPTPIETLDLTPRYDWPLVCQQLRQVVHDTSSAKEIIGYQPTISSKESIQRYKRWRRALAGRDQGAWQLLQELPLGA